MTTCETCNDTHSMSLRGSLVLCTRCPTPCQECRINGRGAYCAKTPCACACHSIVDRPAPTPTPTPGLDLDTAEKRAAGFRGRFRVMAYDVKEAGETWNGDDEQADAWASQIHRVLNCLRTDSDGVIHDGRATAARGTVGGLLATAPAARPISEWHEDHGDALWWRFPIEEPPYCGSPISDDWPGDYHTHWTPIVCPDDPTQRGPLLAATAPVCPGPDCPMCNGEACDKCNPGPGRPRCDHDGQERHELPTAAPRPQCPTHGDTVNCYCTTGALHCHDCGHTPPFCTACDGYHDDGPCPLPKGG